MLQHVRDIRICLKCDWSLSQGAGLPALDPHFLAARGDDERKEHEPFLCEGCLQVKKTSISYDAHVLELVASELETEPVLLADRKTVLLGEIEPDGEPTVEISVAELARLAELVSLLQPDDSFTDRTAFLKSLS